MKWRKKNRRKISISNLHMRDIFKTGTNAIYFYSREFAVCQSKVRFVFVQNIGLCVPFTNWIQPKQRCCAFHVHDHVVLCTCNAKTQKSSRSLARLKSAAQWRCIALACGASRASLIRCHAFCILRLLFKSAKSEHGATHANQPKATTVAARRNGRMCRLLQKRHRFIMHTRRLFANNMWIELYGKWIERGGDAAHGFIKILFADERRRVCARFFCLSSKSANIWKQHISCRKPIN